MNMNEGSLIVIFQDPTTRNIPGFKPDFKLMIAGRPPDPALVGDNRYTADWLSAELRAHYLYEAEDAPLYDGANDLNEAITMAAELYHRCQVRFAAATISDCPTRIYYLRVLDVEKGA